MKIKVLTIPKHRLRNFLMVGHLETLGVPVGQMLGTCLRFFEGYDYRDQSEKKKETIRDWYTDRGIPNEFVLPMSACRAIQWGFYRILEKVAVEDEPSLVLECDGRLQCTWAELNEGWESLCSTEGYERIKCVQLWHNEVVGPKITDLFQRGGGIGQMGNIWTPHGARFVLSNLGNPGFEALEGLPARDPMAKGWYSAIDRYLVSHSNVVGEFYDHFADSLSADNTLYVKTICGESLFSGLQVLRKEVKNMVSVAEKAEFYASVSEQLKDLTAEVAVFQEKVASDASEEPNSDFKEQLSRQRSALQQMLGETMVRAAILEKEIGQEE